jgi:hypothetical protein
LITFSITAQYNPTKSLAWIKRRFNGMMRDVQYGIMMSMVGTELFSKGPHSYIHADISADLQTYILHITMPAAGMREFHAIAHYLAKSNKNYTVCLTPTTTSGRMEPCESHPDTSLIDPPPVTSATC